MNVKGAPTRHRHDPMPTPDRRDGNVEPTGRRWVGRLLLVLGGVMGLVGVALLTGVVPSPAGAVQAVETHEDVPATPLDLGVNLAHNSPQLKVDPTNERFQVLATRIDAPDFSCALQVSGDGGGGWIPVNPVPNLPDGADKCYGPEVAFDQDGTLYYLFVGLAGRGNEPMGVFLTTSTDRGQTFSAPREILGPRNFAVRMAIDPSGGATGGGRLHLAWLAASSDPPSGGFGAPPNPIMTAYSDDGGETLTEPIQVSPPARARVVAPALALGPDHRVHIAYYDLKDDVRDYKGLEGPTWDGTWSLLLSTSADGGDSFANAVIVDDQITPPERVLLIFTMPPPALAAGGQRLCTAWTDGRNGDADAMLRCSDDKGSTWDQLQRLNDDPVGNGRKQYLPQLTIGPSGRVDAIFYDRRNDANNRLNDVYYTFLDQSNKAEPNLRLTDRPSNSTIGQQYAVTSAQGRSEFGARLGLTSNETGTTVAWADTRNSVGGTRAQSVFATQLEVDQKDQGGQGIGIVLVSAGLLILAGGLTQYWRRKSAREITASEVPFAGDDKQPDVSSIPRGDRSRSRWLTWGTAAGILVVVIAGAVLLQPGGDTRPLPPPPPTITVTMTENSFSYSRPISSGRVVFQFKNTGQFPHRPLMIPLNDDVPPIDEQLHGDDRRAAAPFARLPDVAPQHDGTFAVDLVPGQRYALIDFSLAPDGEFYALKGMNSEFRAGGKERLSSTNHSPKPDQATPPSSSPNRKSDERQDAPIPVQPVTP